MLKKRLIIGSYMLIVILALGVGVVSYIQLGRVNEVLSQMEERLIALCEASCGEGQETDLCEASCGLGASQRLVEERVSLAKHPAEAQRIVIALSLTTLLSGLLLGGWLFWSVIQPVNRLTEAARRIAAGDVDALSLGYRRSRQDVDVDRSARTPERSEGAGVLRMRPGQNDPIGILTQVFNDMATQLRELRGNMEEQVDSRTRELEQRARYLQASVEVSYAIASTLEVNQLIQQIVEVIRERFDLYYVGLFLVGETGEWAALQAGTGSLGAELLARGHRIKVGEGIIGWSIAHAQPRASAASGEAEAPSLTEASRQVDKETSRHPQDGGSRVEVALPLRSRGQVIGALHLREASRGYAAVLRQGDPQVSHQDDSSGGPPFDKDTLNVLQTMADQVAIALDNVRLFTESRTALERTRRAYGELSREAWKELVQAQFRLEQRYDPHGILAPGDEWREEMRLAAQEGRTVLSETGLSVALTTPLKVRDQIIGILNAHKPGDTGGWTPEEIALLETLTDQLGVTLESTRLHQDTQRHAARERLLSEVTARIRETLDVDTILRTAAREISEALGLSELVIRVGEETSRYPHPQDALGGDGGSRVDAASGEAEAPSLTETSKGGSGI